jgi:hypothetical protein
MFGAESRHDASHAAYRLVYDLAVLFPKREYGSWISGYLGFVVHRSRNH